jgi:hypothetical protein
MHESYEKYPKFNKIPTVIKTEDVFKSNADKCLKMFIKQHFLNK